MQQTERSEVVTQVLTFEVGGSVYAFDILDVTDIIELTKTTYIPKVPEYIKGVINHRGRVIPIIELAVRFDAGQPEYTSQACIIIANISNVQVGFIAEKIGDAINVTASDFTPSPNRENGFVTDIISVSDRNILLLDSAKIIDY